LLNLGSGSANYDLTSRDEGVQFDLNADGVVDRVAWTRANTNVAFLAIDRNANGQIDNGTELFGNVTRMRNGEIAANGFEVLRDLDLNHDGQIDSADEGYSRMVLWTDLDHDGWTDAGELRTLRDAGVSVVFTDYHETHRTDENGNSYRYSGKALVKKNGRDQPRKVFDVYLRID